MKNNLVFKSVAGFAGLYHLALGLSGVFANKEFAALMINKAYGATVEMTPQVFYLVKFCSAYMVAFAIAMLLLASDPVKYKNLVWVAIALFTIRIAERLMFTELLNSSFGISFQAEMVTSGILVVLIGLLYYFRPKNT